MTKVCIRTGGVDIIHIAADAICDRRKSGHLMCTTGIPGQGSQPTAAAETPDTKKVIDARIGATNKATIVKIQL